ncbi:hypothetical protein ENTCAN_09085 [Enterobacter cancerogenus ATCC 35316]|nr:hypothetical protein ENTCAN_09085 [Enterobacter cancerogenus ATCC 35316]
MFSSHWRTRFYERGLPHERDNPDDRSGGKYRGRVLQFGKISAD